MAIERKGVTGTFRLPPKPYFPGSDDKDKKDKGGINVSKVTEIRKGMLEFHIKGKGTIWIDDVKIAER